MQKIIDLPSFLGEYWYVLFLPATPHLVHGTLKGSLSWHDAHQGPPLALCIASRSTEIHTRHCQRCRIRAQRSKDTIKNNLMLNKPWLCVCRKYTAPLLLKKSSGWNWVSDSTCWWQRRRFWPMPSSRGNSSCRQSTPCCTWARNCRQTRRWCWRNSFRWSSAQPEQGEDRRSNLCVNTTSPARFSLFKIIEIEDFLLYFGSLGKQ